MTQGYTKQVPIDTDPTMANNSNQLVPSQAAVVTYVGARAGTGGQPQYATLQAGAANVITGLSPSTAGQLYTSAGASAYPIWTTSTYPTTNAANTLLYASSANTMAALATANNGVLITSNAGVPSILAESATAGIPLVSGGTGVPPAFTTTVVAGGGTGNTTQTAYSVVCGGTTTTGAFQAVAPVAVGSVLISGGTGALPSFSTAPAVTSITINSGTAIGTYTEGTYSPTILGSSTAGVTTYTAQIGRYVQINKRIFVYGVAIWSGQTGSGNLQSGALPFTVENTTNIANSLSTIWGNSGALASGASTVPVIRLAANSTVLSAVIYTGSSGAISDKALVTSGSIAYQGWFVST